MRRRDLVTITTAALPLVFGIPLLAGVAVSLERLLDSAQPFPGFIGSGINADALALLHGVGLYHDPSTGYVGSVYTPGLALLVSVLDRIIRWSGWVPLICYVSSFVVAGLIGWLACRGGSFGRLRVLVLAQGLGFAALSWWLLSALQNPSLYTGHLDHPAWALAIAGLLLTPIAASGSGRALATAIVLFTLAFWTKQTAVAAPIAAIVWLALHGRGGRRTSLLLAISLLAINGVIAGILAVVTHGWAWRLLFLFGLHQPVYYRLGFILHEFLSDNALVLLLAGFLWTVVILTRLRSRAQLRPGPDYTADYALLLGIFIAVAAAFALQARRVQGGQDNDYIPVTWGLLLLSAVGYASLRQRSWGQIVTIAPIAALFALGLSSSVKARVSTLGIRVPPTLYPAVEWLSSGSGVGPPSDYPVQSYYDWTGTVYSRDDRGRAYAPVTGLLATLALGYSPRPFIDAVLNRRFSALQLFPNGLAGDGIDLFASADGRYEEHFFWKLNRLIASRYIAPPNGPRGILVRRPGPEPDRWMRTCFAPLVVSSTEFYIGRGGGFWCTVGARRNRVALIQTPSEMSEIYTARSIRSLRGELDLDFAKGSIEITAGRSAKTPWRLQLIRRSRNEGIAVSIIQRGRLLGAAFIKRSDLRQSAEQVRIRFGGPPSATVSVVRNLIHVYMRPLAPALPLSVSASAGSQTVLDLTRLGST